MRPGERVAHYEIDEAIGRGGMGVVYRARDTKLDRVVALKFLPPEAARDEAAKKRFVREARAASALDHPNICTIHDIDETDDGRMYIVMAYYEGRTLQERLRTEPFPVARTVAVARQLAAALGRAHDAGIVHRDLKPANVMVLDDGSVKLLDFGIAKLTADQDVTATRGTLGTVTYMSPEQLHGTEVDRRADLWAFGVLLYEMLGGDNPFAADTSAAVVTAILNTKPPPLAQTGRPVPASLSELVERCLRRDPGRRPADAAEVIRALDGVEDGPETGAPTVAADRTAEAATGGGLRIAAVAGLLAIAAAAGYLLWPVASVPEPEPEPAVETEAADLFVVLPFAVRGSAELDYLAEGMVDLISSRIDGLGDVGAVPPRVVFSALQQEPVDPAYPADAARLARQLGADRYVVGDLVAVGDTLTLSLVVHDTSGADPTRITLDGTRDGVMELVDTAVADLATLSLAAPADRLQRIGAMTSHSLEATRAYLAGERLLREGRHRDAAERYDAALELDPEFALAHYRKSIVADWIDAHDVRSSAETALQFAGDLPPRDRDLLEALVERRNGRNRSAERAYRALLHRYPDDVDALLQLGEILFHDGPRSGREILEAYEPLQRALALEPGNASAQIHLARLRALREEHEPLARLAEAYATSAPGSERLLEVQALWAYGVDDAAAQDRVVTELVGKPAPFLFYAAHGVSRFSRSSEGAERILREGGSEEAFLHGIRATLLLEQGRFEDFHAYVDALPESDNATWILYRAFALTSGILPLDREGMLALVDQIRDLEPEEILRTAWLPAYEDMTEPYARLERDYHLAMLLIQTGQLTEARPVVDRLRGLEPLPGLGEMHREVVAGLDAEILWQSDDPEGALEILRDIRYEIPHAISIRSMGDGSRSRFLRAELERLHGDPEIAEGYYLGLDQSWSWWDTGFRPYVYWGLARIAEQEGRSGDARRAYARLVDLWRGADEADGERLQAARAVLAGS